MLTPGFQRACRPSPTTIKEQTLAPAPNVTTSLLPCLHGQLSKRVPSPLLSSCINSDAQPTVAQMAAPSPGWPPGCKFHILFQFPCYDFQAWGSIHHSLLPSPSPWPPSWLRASACSPPESLPPGHCPPSAGRWERLCPSFLPFTAAWAGGRGLADQPL